MDDLVLVERDPRGVRDLRDLRFKEGEDLNTEHPTSNIQCRSEEKRSAVSDQHSAGGVNRQGAKFAKRNIFQKTKESKYRVAKCRGDARRRKLSAISFQPVYI